MCIMSVYTLLKVVGYYDLSVLSMSVMGFHTQIDGSELYPIFLGFLEFFNFAKPLTHSKFIVYVISIIFFINVDINSL